MSAVNHHPEGSPATAPRSDGTEPVRIPSVWVLGLASGLSSFGVTMVIPILVDISARFDAGYASVQFVVSAYVLGLSLAQPFNGILCDRLGRRPVMLVGFATFVIASFGAAWTDSLAGLVLLRFLQAVGVSVGTVASRAVVRDTRSPAETTVAMAHIAAIMGFAPIAGPVIGGWLGATAGYRSIFIGSALMGLMLLILLYRTLPETLDRSKPPPRLPELLGSYRTLLVSRAFIGYTMMFGFVQGSFFSFMAVGAAIFETNLGISARGFGTAWALMSITYVLGAMTAARMIRSLGFARVMGMTVTSTLLAGWLMTTWTSLAGPTMVSLVLPLTVLMITASGVIPGALAGVVNAHPEMSGTASGLSSALGLLISGLFSMLAGVLYDGSFAPIAALVGAAVTLTAVSWLLVRRTAYEQDNA